MVSETDKGVAALTLGELLLKATRRAPPAGDVKGTCVMCSKETSSGLPIQKVVSSNFNGWSYMFAGDCFCPECAFLFSDQTFRRKSWVASVEGGFQVLDREGRLECLFEPPDPPFFIYFSTRGQRQSWLSCLHYVAMNKERYVFAHEDYDIPILFRRDLAEIYARDAAEALALKIGRSEIVSCEFKPASWKKALQAGKSEWLRDLGERKGNPLWEVIARVCPGPVRR